MSPTRTPPTPAESPTVGGSRLALLACVGLACALVLGSGAGRWWRTRQIQASLVKGKESPFPLAELPMDLGDWAGTQTELDPLIVAATGSSDLITRRYVNQATGVAVDLIVLYGPANGVFIHTPELCYPRAGYGMEGEAIDRPVRYPGEKVPFRSIVYAKGDAGHTDRQEVHFSWRFNGTWHPVVARPKDMDRIPGMYKVQVSRRLQSRESRTVDNPCEAFLEALIPALEARIAGQSPPPQATPRS